MYFYESRLYFLNIDVYNTICSKVLSGNDLRDCLKKNCYIIPDRFYVLEIYPILSIQYQGFGEFHMNAISKNINGYMVPMIGLTTDSEITVYDPNNFLSANLGSFFTLKKLQVETNSFLEIEKSMRIDLKYYHTLDNFRNN